MTLNDNGVLANDTDIDDDLDAILVSGPSFGTLTLDEETGTFTYTPNTGFSGTDTFTYKASDDDGAESNVATVTITVTPASAGSVYLIPDACNPGKTALIVKRHTRRGQHLHLPGDRRGQGLLRRRQPRVG